MSQPSFIPGCDLTLREQMLEECEVMARHAMSSGMAVPGYVVQNLESQLTRALREKSLGDGSNADKPQPANRDLVNLAKIHQRLSRLIAPANPRTLLLLARERENGGLLQLFGPLPLIRRVMVAAIISLVALIWISLSPYVTGQESTSDMLSSSGVPLLLNELFFLAAAGLGASFATLFRANKYVIEGTYDPKYDTLYWSQFVLGIISGLILVEFVPIESSNHVTPIARPTLAILGGFSATVVYQILSRLVESVGSIVQGDSSVINQVEMSNSAMRREVSDAQQRMELVSRMVALQSQLQSGANSEDTAKAIHEMTQRLIGSELSEAADLDETDESDEDV